MLVFKLESVFARVPCCKVMMMRNLMRVKMVERILSIFCLFLIVLSSETRLEDKLLKRVRL